VNQDGAGWNHEYAEANGISIHYVRHGAGQPIILLHGWPEFWYVYHENIGPLAEEFDVIVPDLRGFGDTDKPGTPDPPRALQGHLVEDLLALADELGLERFGIVSHDVGSYVAQAFARQHPERVSGLFFFNCVYPGIGRRWLEPETVREIWYQTFNQQPWAADLVGRDREACRSYIGHFLDHWAQEPGVFAEDLEHWVDNFMKPGNLQGGFDWYLASDKGRMQAMRHGALEMPKIQTPARFSWGESDPVLKPEWADGLGDYFADYRLNIVSGAGHFVHYEKPELANREVRDFFGNLG
jgi:pimeloyl-ACP methyl ester carboxylesterase